MNRSKKFLAMFLALAMIFTAIPMNALAAEVDVTDAVGGEIAFGNLGHLVQGIANRAAVPDQQAQFAVAAVNRITGHQQVAQVGRGAGFALVGARKLSP